MAHVAMLQAETTKQKALHSFQQQTWWGDEMGCSALAIAGWAATFAHLEAAPNQQLEVFAAAAESAASPCLSKVSFNNCM